MVIGIDFLTFIAQIVNFLILVFLLMRFLYPRIIAAMDQREKMVTLRFEEAEQKMKEALSEEESYREMKQQLDKSRDEILGAAREEASALSKKLSDEARREVDGKRAQWYDSLEREKDEFLKDLRKRAGGEVLAVIRRALSDLSGEELEHRMIDTFIERLKNWKDGGPTLIRDSSVESGANIVVKSAFDIPAEPRRQIGKALKSRFGESYELEFKTMPELVSGVEIDVQDMRISWSLKSYLNDLEEGLSQTIEQRK